MIEYCQVSATKWDSDTLKTCPVCENYIGHGFTIKNGALVPPSPYRNYGEWISATLVAQGT